MDIIQPTSIFDLSQEIEEVGGVGGGGGGGGGVGGGGGMSWFDYLCQQWFRKLIVSYLHQYQTFLVKTTSSEYTMPSYY